MVFCFTTTFTQEPNLVCKPSFEEYSTPPPNNYSNNYAEISLGNPVPICWYNKNLSGYFKVQLIGYSPWQTKSCQLVATTPIEVCQNLILEKTKEYEISFVTFNAYNVNSSLITAKIDDGVVLSIQTIGTLGFNSSKAYFFAPENNVILCFSTTFTQSSIDQNWGPLFDNVIVKRFIRVPFEPTPDPIIIEDPVVIEDPVEDPVVIEDPDIVEKTEDEIISNNTIKIIEQIIPFVEASGPIAKSAFVYLNFFGLSYFLGNLINFWNFALLYGFLMIESVPEFLMEIIEKMMEYFFISSGSLTVEINKIMKKTDS